MVRRRHRHDATVPLTTASRSTSVADAKAKFIAGVARGIVVLMERGFSRERATACLLREIARSSVNGNGPVSSSSSSSSSTPNDQEVSVTHGGRSGGTALPWATMAVLLLGAASPFWLLRV